MTVSDFDPLALRHGPLISDIWGQIAHARQAAQGNPDQAQAAFWRRRLRHLSGKVRAAHRREMAQSELPTATIDAWFSPIIETLAKAGSHFDAVLAQHAIAAARHLTTGPELRA
ncbi:hypothetical protein [Litoreibacter ponti]|uniref:hypothetical protein n=1 Tax=Litoreibacter ponti TaxID=1510457 RepID=UPI000D316EF2|nr:hypothetical protein [Litoreibacter ponti]